MISTKLKFSADFNRNTLLKCTFYLFYSPIELDCLLLFLMNMIGLENNVAIVYVINVAILSCDFVADLVVFIYFTFSSGMRYGFEIKQYYVVISIVTI